MTRYSPWPSVSRQARPPMRASGLNRIGPRHRLDGCHLVDEIAHDLVVRRHRLPAALVVELAAVVVGRVVRRRDVEPAVRLEEADAIREFRRRQVALAFW